MSGKYNKINFRYSEDMNELLKLLFKVDPKERPNCDEILKTEIIRKRIEFFKAEAGLEFNDIDAKDDNELLKTIKLSKNLLYLKDNLPKPNYSLPKITIKKNIMNQTKLNNIRVLTYLGGMKLCSGNWESNLQIIDLNTKSIIKNISGHFSGVSTMCLINGKYILSGGNDAAMNIYEPDPVVDENNKDEEDGGESCFKGFINGHDDTVSKIFQFKDGKVATCGYDKKINIFGKILDNETKDDFPIIELTEEEKEKLEKEKAEKEKLEKEKAEKEKLEKENNDENEAKQNEEKQNNEEQSEVKQNEVKSNIEDNKQNKIQIKENLNKSSDKKEKKKK